MGRIYLEYLPTPDYYKCSTCNVHLVQVKDLVSKSFQGKTGKAYLFNNVINIFKGPEEEKIMMTGLHKVCDIHCKNCLKVVGWTYLYAFEESEKYKVGKYIVERAYLKKQGGQLDSQSSP